MNFSKKIKIIFTSGLLCLQLAASDRSERPSDLPRTWEEAAVRVAGTFLNRGLALLTGGAGSSTKETGDQGSRESRTLTSTQGSESEEDDDLKCFLCITSLKDFENGRNRAICMGGHVLHENCWHNYLISGENASKQCPHFRCQCDTLVSNDDRSYIKANQELTKKAQQSTEEQRTAQMRQAMIQAARDVGCVPRHGQSEEAFLQFCQTSERIAVRFLEIMPQ